MGVWLVLGGEGFLVGLDFEGKMRNDGDETKGLGGKNKTSQIGRGGDHDCLDLDEDEDERVD